MTATSSSTSAAFTLRLLPGPHELEATSNTGYVTFTVNPNDTVSYDSSYLGVLTGANTNKLVVVGDVIAFDATALAASVPKVQVDGNIESTAAAFTLRLLPGPHELEATSNTGYVTFTVNPNDTVSYDPSYQGVLTGANTNKLVVVGDVIAFDATALTASVPKVQVNGNIESTSAAFTLRLLPGPHELEATSNTGYVTFTVNPNDTVSYGSSYQGVLTGANTNKLVVVGDVIAFDATALAASVPKVQVNGNIESTAAAFTLRLLPGPHELEATSNTGYVTFTVNPNDTVSYGSSYQGVLTGANTNKLVVVGDVIAFDATALAASVPKVQVNGNIGRPRRRSRCGCFRAPTSSRRPRTPVMSRSR